MFDVLIIGAGHAGLEAANAAWKMGVRTAIVTMDTSKMGMPSCNPSIGGSAKGHLVKEIDAMGGVMGYFADRAGISFKMLNTSKGPAIWSPRAQIDKDLYPLYVKNYFLLHTDISFINGMVDEILIEKDSVVGVGLSDGSKIKSKNVILSAGTFLNAVMHTGKEQTKGGRIGEKSSDMISVMLDSYGFERGRLKTGTPPRIHKDSIDYSKCEPEAGDSNPTPFSRKTAKVRNRILCWHTKTNTSTHEILEKGFEDSPIFNGKIEGAGPRYCPSIEDKIARFAERDSHKILLEPEGMLTDSVYVNGFSTSLPLDIQKTAMSTIPGLENAEFLKQGYAVEYDFFYPYQLRHSLETKAITGLFFAGQINGTSGYEEAGVQGMIAGINAAAKIKDIEPLSLKRNQAYTGVLIDDLVNKSTDEPYRIFTSLAEYRLLLRQDNADLRLSEIAHNYGLISDSDLSAVHERGNGIQDGIDFAKSKFYPKERLSEIDIDSNAALSLSQIVKRNEDLLKVLQCFPDDNKVYHKLVFDPDLRWSVENEIKYEGYIKRMEKEISYFLENENKHIPDWIDYSIMESLSTEAKQKLERVRPSSLGQLSRISGISATDVSVVSLYLRK